MGDGKYDRMLDRAKMLLAIAEDPAASESEASTAWEQAQKIMTMYAIEDWQLHSQERRNDPIIRHRVGLSPDPMNRDMADLADFVAGGNRCDTYFESSLAGNNRRVVDAVVFCGTGRDCRQAEMVWTSMEAYRASHWAPGGQGLPRQGQRQVAQRVLQGLPGAHPGAVRGDQEGAGGPGAE